MFFSPSRIYMPARNKTSVCGRKNHEGRQVGLQYKKDSTWSALEVPTFTVQNYLLVQVNLGEIFELRLSSWELIIESSKSCWDFLSCLFF